MRKVSPMKAMFAITSYLKYFSPFRSGVTTIHPYLSGYYIDSEGRTYPLRRLSLSEELLRFRGKVVPGRTCSVSRIYYNIYIRKMHVPWTCILKDLHRAVRSCTRLGRLSVVVAEVRREPCPRQHHYHSIGKVLGREVGTITVQSSG